MQIGGESVENMFMNMMLGKKNVFKNTNPKKHFSMLTYLKMS
jgi:hypothetical protein